jgi:NAD dependent epimerase/dehydratase family enzyme
MLLLALENPQARGPFNTTAPEPERNRAFSTILGRVLGRPSLLPLPGFALELLLGEMAIPLLIEKQRALPKKALELGYQFAYPRLEPALRATLGG